MDDRERLVEVLRAHLEREPDVVLSFLFGSRAANRATPESDVDVAVYLRRPESEDRIWARISRVCKGELDIITLNNAPAALVSAVLKTGIPLSIRDTDLYWRLYLEATAEAEDFAAFTSEYWSIAERSSSLTPEDRIRLARRVQFLQEEWKDLASFSGVTLEVFSSSKGRRRETERWAENMANATIDVAKIILASEGKPAPLSYQGALRDLAVMAGMSAEEAEQFSTLARLRNLLAHEYLDLLHSRIRDFMDRFPPLYDRLFQFLAVFLRDRGDGPPKPER